MGELDGTVALVTGASSGIGEATARRLAQEGATLALAARRRDRLDGLAADIEKGGGRALILEVDVGNRDQAENAVATTVAELGRLDTLVNNAGVMLLGPAIGGPVEEWEQMVRVNLLGLMYCAHAALPHLISAAESSPRSVADMVNISSTAGRVARAGSSGYNATKFAVVALTEALRQEVTRGHVRISVVEPGAVATELQDHNRPEILENIRQRFSDIRTLEASDIADTISFMVTRPRHVAINEILVRPTEQQF